jgi:hypothetical protein
MLKRFLKRRIGKMEARYGYDASYMRYVLEASLGSAMKFAVVSQLVDAKAAPAEALAAAKLAGTLAEDCGPCTQIVADMALEAGARPQVVRAVLTGDPAAMGEDAGLVWRFCQASLARDMLAADPLRDEIVRRWGDAGLTAIGLSLTVGRMYPTLKYALGYGKACSKVTVAGEAAALAHAPTAA